MNEEALQYSFELFTNDGYEGTIEEYKELLKNDQEALDYSYDLFSKDGYDGEKQEYNKLIGAVQEDTQDFPTAVATETAPVTADATAEDTDLALVDTSLESPEAAVEVEDPLSSWQSIKNSFSNLGEQVGDVFEFWLDTEGEGGGARASLDIASNAVWSMMFGQESVDEYVKEKGKDSYMAKGVGSESTLKSIKKFEEEKLESKETKGVIESIKNGDIGGAFAGTINALTSAVGSVAFGVGTVGAGFLSEYVAENYVEFNKLKAKNLGISVDELIKSGEADTAIPVGMGIVSSSLEYVGIGAILKGVKGASKGTAGSGNLISQANKYLAAKTIYSKNARAVMNTLATGTTEFTTEILQHAADEVNKEFGSVAGTDKEAKVGKAFIDAITSQEGLEAGVQGFLGGGGLAAGSYSAKAMNTIRTITDARSIDKSLNALSSVRAKYNKSTDDVVKEGLQKEIDNKESEIADAVRNGNIIYENLTDGQISEIETLTDLADASAYKVTELNKKLRSGEISEETYNSAKSGFDTEYKSARQKLLDMQLDKNLEFAKEEGLKRGLEFEVYENQKDFNEAVLAVKNVSEESVKEFKDIKGRTHGTSIGNKILINKEFAREEGAINVGSHELLHPIFNKLIGDSKNQGKFVRQFKRSMTSSQRRFIDGEMKRREYTGKQYNTEYMNVFSDALREKQINYDKTTFEKIGDAIVGLFKPRGYENISFDSGQDVYNFIKEYDQSADKGALTSKAEKALGDVDLSDAVLTSKQGDEVISKSKPFNELQDQLNELDIMDFDNEIEYDQAIANLENKIRLTKRKETLAKREVKKEVKETLAKREVKKEVKEKVVADKKIFDNEGLVETIKYKETTKKEKSNAETELLESFDALALKAIKYDTRKGDYDRTEIRDYLRQFLPGIIDRYDPNQSKFSTYVTKTMAPKAQQTYERFRKIADRSLDVTAGELGSVKETAAEESTSTQETVKKPSRKIKPIELIRNLGLQKKYKDSVKKIVEGGKALVDGNTFGNLKDLAAEVTAEIFDIPLLKVTDPADNLAFKDVIVDASNISKIKVYYPDAKVGMVIKSESSKIQDIIKSMGPDLFKLLPPENVAPELATVDAQAYKGVKGTGLKIPSSLMKAFYEATGKRSKGVTSQVAIKKLKPGLTYEQFLKELGIVKGQPNTYDRAIGQRLKAITTLFGKLATNTEVRQLEGVTDVQAQNIAAGKSDIQFSKTFKKVQLSEDQKKSLTKTINELKSKEASVYLTNDIWSSIILKINESKNIYETFKSISDIVDTVLTTKGRRQFEIKLLNSLVELVDGDTQSAIVESFEEYRKIFKYEYRTIGFNHAKSNLKNNINKAKKPYDKIQAVLNFIKYESRSIRTGNIDGIRTNESLFNELLKPLGVEDLGFKLLKKDGKTFITLNDVVLTGMLDITKIKEGFTPETVSLMNSEALNALNYIINVLKGLSLDKAKGYLNLISLDQRGILRKLSKPGFEITGFKPNELMLEHETTALSIYKKLIDFNTGSITEKNLRNFIEKSKVNLIPKTLDKLLNKNNVTVLDEARYNVEEFVKALNKYKEEGKYKNIEYSNSFVKTDLNKTLKSKKYKKFIKDIKDKTLYHGGSDTLSSDATWFYINDLEAAEMWGDNKVYSVKVSDLDTNMIIPDLNDVGEFAKYASKKFKLPKEKFYDIRDVLSLKNADEIISEWFDWFSTNSTEWDLGYNIYEDGKVTDGAVTVLGNLPKSKMKLSFSKSLETSEQNKKDFYSVWNTEAETQADLYEAVEKARKPNNKTLPEGFRLSGNFTNQEVLDKMKELDDQQAEAGIQFSNSQNLDKDFNDILEKKTGIASDKEYKRVKAEVLGASKGRFSFFIPPSAEDFVGLLYATLGKNKTGDAQMAWYKKNLLNPFARAMENVSRDRNSLGRDFKALKKTLKIVPKNLKKKLPGEPFTTEQAVRVWIWNQIGKDVPGLDDADVKTLVDYVNSRPDLQSFGTEIMKLNKGTAYTSPTDSWNTGTITTDLLETLNTTKRKEYLELWQQNVDIIFSEKNLNKLEAIYGKQYRKAMENILSRMKTGKNRVTGSDSLTTRVTDWLTGSIGAIMFFNTRSAVLQTLSAVNFINFGDNNILAAGKAFANQKQYWTDFKKLFNSEFLIERRDGLKMNVNEADIADIAKEKGVRGVINKLLKLGFTPTQLADSFAIASGGSTFYRNRLNALIKGGMNTQAAEKQAMSDFREIAEESQQSSRPDKISQQQAGPLGRIVLAFANTPAQYARLIKKAASDLKNGRGDAKTNISKIIYYGVAQNLIFNALQQALFAISFGEDEEEDEKKVIGIANGMADSLLRGIGIGGAIISTVKNAGLKLAKENAKKNPKYEEVAIELLKISPPVASKIGKVRAAGRSYSWDKKEMKEKGWSLDNPAYLANANIISAASNIPLDRVIKKIDNITASTGANLSFMQRVALLAGWSEWQLGINKDDKKTKSKKGRTINKRVINKRVVNKRTIN